MSLVSCSSVPVELAESRVIPPMADSQSLGQSSGQGMSPTEHTLEGDDDMSAHDTSILIEVLDCTEVPFPNTA